MVQRVLGKIAQADDPEAHHDLVSQYFNRAELSIS